ncbi:MAG: translation initiation factor [Phycisphaerales bacterium]|nr:translation initiation factor [Phycisphaerales bacterium]
MGLFAGTPLERPVTCERCGNPLADCRCPREPGAAGSPGRILLPKDQPVRVQRERRRDKTVTVVRGVTVPPEGDPAAFLRSLKTRLGTGGTLTDGALELQGDHVATVVAYLRSLGYPAKAAGG